MVLCHSEYKGLVYLINSPVIFFFRFGDSRCELSSGVQPGESVSGYGLRGTSSATFPICRFPQWISSPASRSLGYVWENTAARLGVPSAKWIKKGLYE